MCLYPKKMINKKYTATEKNGGCVPLPPIIGKDENGQKIYDERILYVEVPCGQCEECRQAKTREWRIRLGEEIKEHKYNYFVTLTFSPEELKKILEEKNIKECNAAAGYAVRHMLEYYRKDHKCSIKHWLITELGHEGTERIHLHGLLFTDTPLIFGNMQTKGKGYYCTWKYWKYGLIYVGSFCTQQTINYIVKYINKIDTEHKGFIGQILASPGIGANWLNKIYTNVYEYRKGNTVDYIRENSGDKVKLPRYYKNHLYTEEERENIWRDYLDTDKTTLAGNIYSAAVNDHDLENVRKKAKEVNTFRGYGSDDKEWKKKPYNITRRMIRREYLDKYKQNLHNKGIIKEEFKEKVKKYAKNLDI